MLLKQHVFTITCAFILHVTLGVHVQAPTKGVNPAECRSLVDLYVVIDGSDSISYRDFGLLKNAVGNLVTETDLGHNKARIGMLVYSAHVPKLSEHDFSYNKHDMLNAAQTLEHPRDGTDTALGIKHMIKFFKKSGRKGGVPWVCVVITDGISKNKAATLEQANIAAKMGISMFAVGIGRNIDMKELEGIASTPNQVMAIDDFSQLQNMLNTMMYTICPCPVPPTLARAKCNDGPRAIGSVRTYQCASGYLQRGNPTIQCQSDFTWTPLSADFECVPCGKVMPVVNNGICGGSEFTIGTIRTYSCKKGYRPIGNPDIKCLNNAIWSTPSFKCVPCGQTPSITNGVCGDGDYTIGTHRTLSCLPGYRASGTDYIECLDNPAWSGPQWSQSDFKCMPCGQTPEITNGACGEGKFSIGSKRTLSCLPGYRAIGTDYIECLDNTAWSGPQWSQSDFKCMPCGQTPSITNGACGEGKFSIGSKRTLSCLPGYRAIGTDYIECLDNPAWSGPQWSQSDFKCMPCGQTPSITNGACGEGKFSIGSKRTLSCLPGYRAIGTDYIECLDNPAWSGPQWSQSDFKCMPCGQTPEITNGACGEGKFSIGSQRTLSCLPGYRAIGTDYIECLDNPAWSGPQWSQSDFKCMPCGQTPEITNGACGEGKFSIGSQRTLSCLPGYRAIGTDYIECLDNTAWSGPQWSQSDFKCMPCGQTPDITNGACDEGKFSIGSKRTLSCLPGYRAIGTDYIECLDNPVWSGPQWSQSDFKCMPCGQTPEITNGACGEGTFSIGSKRTLSCLPGYRAIGTDYIECLDNTAWSGPQWSQSNFKCMPCGQTPEITNGACGEGKFSIGSKRTLSCLPGYRAIGTGYIECLDNPAWSGPQWSQSDFKCMPCGQTPEITNGACGEGKFSIGSKRTISCLPGYRASGTDYIECLDNPAWSGPQWSQSDFKCMPCGQTPEITNGACGEGKFSIGSQRTLSCLPGYRAIGTDYIECLDNTAWSGPQWSQSDFKCMPCGQTPEITNGACGEGKFSIGSKRTLSCLPGYRAIGTDYIECLDNPAWSGPQWSQSHFKCMPCGQTPSITNGACGEGKFSIGSKRTLSCLPGYRAIGTDYIECLDNPAWSGPQWSQSDFKCMPCGQTPSITNGACGEGKFSIGSKRTLSCLPGYRASGTDYIECLDNTAWSGPQWSQSDFKCMPCGQTPEITNGACGEGKFSIGSKRTISCLPGYRAIGTDYIECLDNPAWSGPQWSQSDFKCMPCGQTPNITNGACGEGKFTIGSHRTLSCLPGYRASGTDYIECLDNPSWSGPQWSQFDFKCMSCGQTPDVGHATCNEGSSLIGTERTYTCANGYVLRGKPTTICQNDATWSKPSFSCNDCGDPPVVANAYTGTGPSTVGAKRVYFCEDGFKMVGKGVIKCKGIGKWGKPKFSCEGVITTPPSTEPGVCDRCRFINGVGYNNHPYDCNQYVQCFKGNRGMEPAYRKCPFGQFWDQNVLTCRPSHEVDCPHDKCKNPLIHSYKHSDLNKCCAYWKCQNGRAYGECCGDGSSYNDALKKCVTNYECSDVCPFHDETPFCGDKRPSLIDTMFEQHIGNNFWVKMHCAPGTAYNPVDCRCSLHILTVPGKKTQQLCRPEIYLSFNNGFGDRSGKNVYIKPENVTIHRGAALFNGNSRIMINRFANTEFYGDLVIKFRYNEFKRGSYFNKLQALVTNGDCGSDPSVIVAKMPGYVLLGAKADQSRSFALPTLDKQWKEVIYMHNMKQLEGRVCGASKARWSYGPIKSNHCALQVGYGSGLQSYVGLIDDLYVYQCRPRNSELSIGY